MTRRSILSMASLREAARLLGGEVSGRGILAPGPGHSPRDRSMSVTFSPEAPEGFTVFSHAGDDWRACRDHVKARLSIERENSRATSCGTAGSDERTAHALEIWRQAVEPAGTPVSRYLRRTRGLSRLPVRLSEAIRYHPACPIAGKRAPAMVALVRNIYTNEPQAIHRTVLDLDGNKAEIGGKDKLALGPLRDGVVKLTPDCEVTQVLGIGEGIESTLAMRRLKDLDNLPVWAALNAGQLAAFPVLSGVETIWIAVDNDQSGTGDRDARVLADRWHAADREVIMIRPHAMGADLADLTGGRGHAA